MAKDRMDREERKQLRAPDEFVTTTTNVIEWASKNSRTVAIAAGAVVAVLLAVGFFSSHQNAQRREANADLAAGIDDFRGGEYAAAASELDQVARQWNESAVAPLAALMAANSELRAGKPDTAIETVQALAADELPSYLRQQRDLVLGAALEAKKDWAGAAERYAAAAAADGPYRGEAMIGEARVRAAAGEADRARELYQRVMVEFPERMDREFLASKAG